MLSKVIIRAFIVIRSRQKWLPFHELTASAGVRVFGTDKERSDRKNVLMLSDQIELTGKYVC